MNIGFVSYWFPRGQSYVTKHLISIVRENTNHNIFLLTRKGNLTAMSPEWDIPNLTIGPSEYDIPLNVYIQWIKKNKIDLLILFQNYQFKELFEIKKMGVKIIGTFMWEQFNLKHSQKTKEVYDLIYVLHESQIAHMNKFGINSELVRWGIHPSLFRATQRNNDGKIKIVIPNGYNTDRKNTDTIKNVIQKIKRKDIIFKILSNKSIDFKNQNVLLINKTFESQSDFLQEMGNANICLIPSLWEGLGFALYESHALKLGIITTNYPPMSDHVIDDVNGKLIPIIKKEKTNSGIFKANFKEDILIEIIENLTIKKCEDYSLNSKQLSKKFTWNNTVIDFLKILNKIR